jgi:hypothetical protein
MGGGAASMDGNASVVTVLARTRRYEPRLATASKSGAIVGKSK